MTIWQRAADCVDTTVEDNVLLLDIERGKYSSLNSTAGEIWSALAEPMTEQAIVDAMMEKYDVEQDRCAEAVAKALQQMEELGLAERAE